MSFEIRILFNDIAGQSDLKAGIGFSALIGEDLLFDTGNSGESLLSNMEVLGIDPAEINKIVISHDHWDHTGGLEDILSLRPGITVYGCPGFSEELKILIPEKKGVFVPCDGFRQIDPGIFLTGEMSTNYNEIYLSEHSLVLETEKGTSVITGCAHPGIVSIIDSVIEHFSLNGLYSVTGGFHLKRYSEEDIDKVLDDLENRNITLFAPMHCTGENAIRAFNRRFGGKVLNLKSGDSLVI